MYVNVAVLKETQAHERRVALVPGTAAKLTKLGARLHMQPNAGDTSKHPDGAFDDVVFIADRHALVSDADVVLAVQPPALDIIEAMKEGAILISFIYAGKQPALVQRLLDKKITCFAMERITRISRAQAMDALSSQSALAGYYTVQLGSTHLGRVLPKITSAAGAIGPAHVLVMGLGVAGLEAVAAGVDATGKGGYARALTAAEKGKIDGVVTLHIQQSDLIITTAAIPGRPTPKLISAAQVAGMKDGAVIGDLSAEGGGNCEDTQPGQTTGVGGVTILAPLNVPSLLAQDASELYAKNVAALLALMLKDNVITLNLFRDAFPAACCVLPI